MSLPRQVLALASYLATRRCMLRLKLLNPCLDVNQMYLYCLA
jgi:hypothetical protein